VMEALRTVGKGLEQLHTQMSTFGTSDSRLGGSHFAATLKALRISSVGEAITAPSSRTRSMPFVAKQHTVAQQGIEGTKDGLRAALKAMRDEVSPVIRLPPGRENSRGG